jgi:hypothetical protein
MSLSKPSAPRPIVTARLAIAFGHSPRGLPLEGRYSTNAWHRMALQHRYNNVTTRSSPSATRWEAPSPPSSPTTFSRRTCHARATAARASLSRPRAPSTWRSGRQRDRSAVTIEAVACAEMPTCCVRHIRLPPSLPLYATTPHVYAPPVRHVCPHLCIINGSILLPGLHPVRA